MMNITYMRTIYWSIGSRMWAYIWNRLGIIFFVTDHTFRLCYSISVAVVHMLPKMLIIFYYIWKLIMKRWISWCPNWWAITIYVDQDWLLTIQELNWEIKIQWDESIRQQIGMSVLFQSLKMDTWKLGTNQTL